MICESYKYVKDFSAVQNLLQGNLKFTPYSDLNDPNEMFSGIDWRDVEKSLIDLINDGYSENQFEWLKHQNNLLRSLNLIWEDETFPKNKEEATQRLRSRPEYKNKNIMENYHAKIINEIRKKVGILSLSLAKDKLPMWAHYADGARGYVVVFRNLDKLFTVDQTSSLNHLKQVNYVKHMRGMTFDPCTQDLLFFTKHTDWEYENELRVVKPLSMCERDENNHHIFKIDVKYIAGVICGWRCDNENINLVRRAIANHNSQAFLRSSVVVNGQVEVRELPQ